MKNPPFDNCAFKICDLPGQCNSEGKCHHPLRATPALADAAIAERGAFKLLAALVDIYDDGMNNAPEDRCYVEGAWKETLDEARAYIATRAALATTGAPMTDAIAPTEGAITNAWCVRRGNEDLETWSLRVSFRKQCEEMDAIREALGVEEDCDYGEMIEKIEALSAPRRKRQPSMR